MKPAITCTWMPESAKLLLPLTTPTMSSGQPTVSAVWPSGELAGVQHERLAVGNADGVHQLVLRFERVDVRQAAVAHDAELLAQAHVDGGRLHQLRVVRVEQGCDPSFEQLRRVPSERITGATTVVLRDYADRPVRV